MIPLFYKTKDGKWKLMPLEYFEYVDGEWRVIHLKIIGCSEELRQFIDNHSDKIHYSVDRDCYILKLTTEEKK